MLPSLPHIFLASLLLVLTACQGQSPPAYLANPQAHPTTIPDPLLREAWQALDNHNELITLWGENSISGHMLAQFVREQAIPVVWDMENVCEGGSCSVNDCIGEVCTQEAGLSGNSPIYISLLLQNQREDQMQRLVASLAHEIYHRMEPFGKVRSTQYEEFTALYLAAQISRSTWQKFEGYDPRNPVCLRRWFNDHRLFDYLDLPDYPQSVVASLDFPAPTECPLEGDLVCTMTLEGQADCQIIGAK